MNKLRQKITLTLLITISLIGIVFVFIYNIQNYNREYNAIKRNLTKIDMFDNTNDFTNNKILDYDVYTLILDKNNNIVAKISHNEYDFNENIINNISDLLNYKSNRTIIGNLYLSKYAYNINPGEFLNIVDLSNVKTRLYFSLYISILIFIIYEIVVYFIILKIVDWITKPVEESFNNQKDFIANASHELKTPLAVMVASIDCLEPSKKNEKWINNLKDESEKMNHLITRLLTLSKTENINPDTFEVCNISKIIEKRALTFESLAFEKNVKIITSIDDNINYYCNKFEIDELASILIDNAIKHSYNDTEVVVSLVRSKSDIIFKVINKGDNIEDKDKEKIFERFYRADTSHNRKENRYGLGLSIAKNIVTNHNGSIKADSINNETTFTVILKEH